MYSLDKRQVELIVSDVESARITFSHLADELIDHICCEVENEMWNGTKFEEAYELVKQQTGIKVLKEIQENTHYLIDKNYRIMKMTMKITGNVSLAMLGLGTVMKLFHWPLAGLMLIIGFMVLCLVFFPSAIYSNYKESKISQSKLLHISILLGGIFFMAGVLFKVMHWPVANTLLLAGWVFILLIFLPLLLFVKLRESNSKKEKGIIALGITGLIIFELASMFKMFHWPGAAMLMIFGAILLVSLFLPLYSNLKLKETGKITGQYIFTVTGAMFFILLTILLALNVSKDSLGTMRSDIKNSSSVVSYLELKNQKIYAELKEKSDSTSKKYESQIIAIEEETKNLCKLIESININLIMAVDEVNKQTAENLMNSIDEIKNQTNSKVSYNIMLGVNSDGSAFRLKKELRKLQDRFLSAKTLKTETKEAINKLLDTSDITVDATVLSWEQYTFESGMTISAIAALKDVEKRVRMAESQVILSIINQ